MKLVNNKIVFYSSIERNFRSTLLGYLIELQNLENIEIIFLYEQLHIDLLNFLKTKKYFPRIIEFIYIGQYDFVLTKSVKQYKKFCLLANNIIFNYSPDLILTSSDFHSVFELFISRSAKKNKTVVISVACSNSVGEMKKISKWIRLYSINTKFNSVYKPIGSLLFFIRKYLGHFAIHYLYPLLSGNLPFWGRSSFLLYKGQSGMRDATYQIVFSNQEKMNFEQSGVSKKKLVNIQHPYNIDSNRERLKYIFNSTYDIDFLILHSAELIGFSSSNFSLIDIETRINENIKIFKQINNYFPDKYIWIKLHPNVSSNTFEHLQLAYSKGAKNLIFIDHSIPIEILLLNAKVTIDLPRPVSTSIFINSLLNPNGISISLDLFEEFLGDYYKFNNSVEYITKIASFNEFLIKYKDNLYSKKKSDRLSNHDYKNLTSFLIDKSLIT